jgi:hypothetical protein
LTALDAELDQAESQIEQEGELPVQSGYRLPESLADKAALREKVRAGLQEMERIDRQHLHPQEPEARRMSCEGNNPFGYNAQVVVDEKAGVVVAARVNNQENDAGLLVPMTQEAQQNCGSASATMVVDSGYGSGGDIAQAASSGLKVLVQPHGQAVAQRRTYHAYNFEYEPGRGVVICPQGKELKHARAMRQKGQTVQIYRCDEKDCPVRAQCTRDCRARRFVEIWPHTLAVQQMRVRLKDPAAAAQLRKRRQIVERIFGHIKHHDGFRRWTVRGLEGVNAQWALICCAMNLRVLYGTWRRRR